MENDEELVKIKDLTKVGQSSSPAFDKNPRLEESLSFDGARVSEEDGKTEAFGDGGGSDDIDVNLPLKDLSTRRNSGERKARSEEDSVGESEIEKLSKVGGYGNGEIKRIGEGNGDDGLTQKAECGGDDGNNDDKSELLDDYDKEGKIFKSPRRRGCRSKIEGGNLSNSDVKGDLDKITSDVSSGISQRTRNRVVRGKKEDVVDMEVGLNVSTVDGLGDQETAFCVGDFVWGKIKSHPWWPGRIYSPLNASEFAMKYKHEGRLLVAYYGDGTFAWCDPSQLKSFEPNFEEMSKQSSLKSFVNAVEETVEEFGRLVELDMTCSCARKGGQSLLPLAVNAGIKEGVHVPLDGVEKVSVDQFEPAVILADIKRFARFSSTANMLELTVLKSRLSAFYYTKGGYMLPIGYEPMGIEELVHQDTVPEEGLSLGLDVGDRSLSPEDHPCMRIGPETSNDIPGKRRKEKSIAELLGLDTKVELGGKHLHSSKRGMQSSKFASKSKKKTRKVFDEDQIVKHELDDGETGGKEGGQSGKLASKSNRRKIVDENQSHVPENVRVTRSSAKKKEGSARLTTAEKKALNAKEDGHAEKDQMEIKKRPRDRRMSVSLKVDNSIACEEGHERMSPRERKRSKYLSPPYTNLLQKQRNSILQMGSETRGLDFSDVAKTGERVSRAAGKLVGSPPIMKCSAETFQKFSRGVGSAKEKTKNPDHQACRADLSWRVDDSMNNMGSSNKVLCEIQSAARDPIYSRKDQSFDSIRGFVSSYRSANYKNGSNYQIYKKHMTGQRKRKRVLSDTRRGSDGKVVSQVDQQSSQPKTHGRSVTKRKDRGSDSKADKESATESSSSAALVMTFPPEFTLPSKEDLMKIHSNFGLLDESKSKVLPKSSTAKIVFIRGLDAKVAMDRMQQSSPFGNAEVNYKVHHLTAASKRTKEANTQNKKKSKLSHAQESKLIDHHPPAAPENEPLAVIFIKQKLEAMTSMLAQTDGKMTEGVKSNLENEVKELLKKVKMMTASSSS